MGTRQHKRDAPSRIRLAVISISSTRTLEQDKSGQWIVRQARKEGHDVLSHRVVPDDPAAILEALEDGIVNHGVEAALLTGGTGISEKDVTLESVKPLFEKELTAFGPLFAFLSFEEIDSAALLSRACAGVYKKHRDFQYAGKPQGLPPGLQGACLSRAGTPDPASQRIAEGLRFTGGGSSRGSLNSLFRLTFNAEALKWKIEVEARLKESGRFRSEGKPTGPQSIL